MNGFLVIDKPGGMTSRDVVNRVQKWFPRKTKIGHTGTLDPLATGVLVVCIGAATRLADYVQAMGKSYASRFRLGATSTTDDADGEVTELEVTTRPTREQIDATLVTFIGNIEQTPPSFSAVKVEGKRAHKLARKGEDVKLSARTIRIDAIRIVHYAWPFLDVEIDCGKGTYIRSIARDLGEKLGCGGLVQTLRRTRIGRFTAEQGIALDVDPRDVKLLPMSAAIADMPQVCFTSDEVLRFRMGQTIVLTGEPSRVGDRVSREGGTTRPLTGLGSPGLIQIAIHDETGELVAIGICDVRLVKPHIVFHNS